MNGDSAQFLEVEKPVPQEPVTLPARTPQESYNVRSYQGQTGKKVDSSPVRYEVIRMLLDGVSYPEIVNNLRTHFGFKVAELTVAAFKKNFFHYYRDCIDRWDKHRYQYVLTRITNEMKEATDQIVHEVYELQHLIGLVDERINLIREDEDRTSATYEGVLKDYIKAKAGLLQRLSEITGSTGMEQQIKAAVKQTALAAQKTLVPYLREERRDTAYQLFDQEIEDILLSAEASSVNTSKPSKI